jgi:hypothetical protein
MRIFIALLALLLAEVFPLAARAETTAPATTKASVASHGGDMAGRLAYESTAPYAPSVTLELRMAAGHDEALLGPLPTFYRTQPELLFGLRPSAQLQIFAGGGVGAAYVVPDPLAPGTFDGPTVTVSGALGARFPWEHVPVTATARFESVHGCGMAATFDIAVALADAR